MAIGLEEAQVRNAIGVRIQDAMERRHADGRPVRAPSAPPVRTAASRRASRAALLPAALVLACLALAWPPAPASAAPAVPQRPRTTVAKGDRGPITVGNGRHNFTYGQLFSPTYMRGAQHVSNASVVGHSPSQSAFCRKRHKVCHISERMWVSGHHRPRRGHRR
ncbi:hypothetical protein Sme01_67370 [Sphaerisporangium melleum]|uniref:Uncharacterized protein n=1 Tax=Sphaerisporangium melleum TaxID=321316 RepID=A0A917RHF4_9ACTN|nr:hypothetical protein [Sphaerisporangium melleum]GGL07700.1 hypothetical protein GCM10007964_57460 [Sphaerisporangium melleum]GII74261.1 hypothetical protein Sme01_67370 [Sphaerisporangium melleum]